MRPEASPIELSIGSTHFYSKKKAKNVITFYNINIFYCIYNQINPLLF